MLQLHIDTIDDAGITLDREIDADRLPLLRRFCREAQARFCKPVHALLRAQRSRDTVYLSGRVATAVHLTCSRCLTDFDWPVDIAFETTAVPHEAVNPDADTPQEVELTAADMDLVTYHGSVIELSEEIAQQILMALPFNPRCKPDCKGLCTHCGTNLNQASCACRARDASSPFAVLKNVSLPDKKV